MTTTAARAVAPAPEGNTVRLEGALARRERCFARTSASIPRSTPTRTAAPAEWPVRPTRLVTTVFASARVPGRSRAASAARRRASAPTASGRHSRRAPARAPARRGPRRPAPGDRRRAIPPATGRRVRVRPGSSCAMVSVCPRMTWPTVVPVDTSARRVWPARTASVRAPLAPLFSRAETAGCRHALATTAPGRPGRPVRGRARALPATCRPVTRTERRPVARPASGATVRATPGTRHVPGSA